MFIVNNQYVNISLCLFLVNLSVQKETYMSLSIFMGRDLYTNYLQSIIVSICILILFCQIFSLFQPQTEV